ncbi:MAG: glycosyltransferase family 4 protein, partial [Gammaproteobacteria bacterium]|nr:glycosyltransferase family 4 protein [Gammaproteobacteria bacterium]
MTGPRALSVALISTDYPPLRTSAAVQMRDLAAEMLNQGHKPVVIVPAVDLASAWETEVMDGVTVLRLAAPRMRDIGHVRRTLSELSLSFLMLHRLRKSPYGKIRWDLVAWYSPTIFFGPLVWFLKRSSGCRTYLILRDIFPEWALDLGLMRKGVAYAFFRGIANLQYAVADTIGVQTRSNLAYLARWAGRPDKCVEVLHNWQAQAPSVGSTINVAATPLAGRKIIVYIGNMGVAQGMDILVDLAQSLRHHDDFGFIFVGRGSQVPRLKATVASRGMSNTLFFDEVDSREMPGLLAQCFIGLLALDPRHRTHNIPGKFLTYLLAGLPVLARVNPGTDLAHLINDEGVGRAYDSVSAVALREFLEDIADRPAEYAAMASRGRALAASMFSPDKVVRQIIRTATSNELEAPAERADYRCHRL